MSATGLVLENVRIALKDRTLVDLSLDVAPGHIATVMGPSGSGKSTLLAYVGGFLEPAFTAAGRVLLNGTDITRLAAHRRHVGILFQDDLLFPHLSVAGNLAFALPESGRGRAARRQRVEDALSEIGLEGHGDRDPATLSGGQRARVALMRVLLSEPHALLLDEPFSKLDATLRAQIRDLVFAKARERDLPVLLVTHDPADAEAAGNHVVSL
ncbi:ATP-binding cassette domain-containing protein [Rhodobium gokarnense]|uniref:Thiamine transport system ATP-binding protein n=1 Tax=Rhodobium gokarnense TaxID=364296 RepID=A0ABT3HGN0_9HYPH|nr:ATP-binding cassette domain-containing protein [Rhodobium gokarnense]MCW2309548.1 putative thiamine transport system ATP-binding protein [Rhodobium gokarnense]